MKVGDVYYCIKDRYVNDRLINKSGKTYEIVRIREQYNRVIIQTEKKYTYFYSIKSDGKSWLFSEHFVSLPEYRKLKLKKINDSSE